MCIKYNIIKNIIRNLIIMFFDLKISCHFKNIYIYIYSKRYCLNIFSIKNFNQSIHKMHYLIDPIV